MEKMLESPDEYDIRQLFRNYSITQKIVFFFLLEQRKNNENTKFNVSQEKHTIQVLEPVDDDGYSYGNDEYYDVTFFPYIASASQEESTFMSDGVQWTQKPGNNCCVCGDGEAFEVEGVTTTQFEINGIKIIGYKCIDCHSDNKRLCSSAFKGETCKREIIKDNVASLLMCLNEWGIPKDITGVIGGSVVDVACCV